MMTMTTAASRPESPMGQTIRRFLSDPAQVGAARQFVRELLAGHPRVDDIEVCASEIVTNAVCHPAPDRAPLGVEVAVQITEEIVLVRVTDGGGSTTPTIKQEHEQSESGGRGMFIVEALADEWGFNRAADGATRVWFTVRSAQR